MGSSKKVGPLKRCNFVEVDEEVPPLKKCSFAETQSSQVSKDVETSIKRVESDPLTHMDSVSFLSNNGETDYLVRSNGEFVRLEKAVRGKHLLICSAALPVTDTLTDDTICVWRVLTDMYPDLSQAGFECVVSITTKRNKKHAFDTFFSTLPCLAIPFSDLDTRKSVCSFINSNFDFFGGMISAIMVDPTGLISSYDRNLPRLIRRHRFEWFSRDLDDIVTQDKVLKIRLDPFQKSHWENGYIYLPESVNMDVLDQPVSLHKDILLCEPSRLLWRFGGADHQSLPVSELSNTYVALYMCVNGNFMKELSEAYKKCKLNNQDLEVVLICLPMFEEPKLYYEKVIMLLKRYDIKSWFIFPYDSKACHRMWRVFCGTLDTDKLIILPPNCKSSGELEGRAVINRLGIDTYPFTRNAVFERRYTTLKSLNPASLFKGKCEKRTCLIRNGKNSRVPHSAIKGKKLLLYIDWLTLSVDRGQLCSLLMELYPKIKAKGCEVVFVPILTKDVCPHPKVADMPWPMMPVETANETLVADNFSFEGEGGDGNKLIVFGKDGKILSRWIRGTLMAYGLSKLVFGDYVRKELWEKLNLLEEYDKFT